MALEDILQEDEIESPCSLNTLRFKTVELAQSRLGYKAEY